MPKLPKTPPTKSSQKTGSASSEIKRSAELRKMTREGRQFANIVGNHLARYAVEAAARMNAASAHAAVIDKLDSSTRLSRLSDPNPALAEQVALERDTATIEFERSRAAAEALLQTEAKT